jgi:hypothetical protein
MASAKTIVTTLSRSKNMLAILGAEGLYLWNDTELRQGALLAVMLPFACTTPKKIYRRQGPKWLFLDHIWNK